LNVTGVLQSNGFFAVGLVKIINNLKVNG